MIGLEQDIVTPFGLEFISGTDLVASSLTSPLSKAVSNNDDTGDYENEPENELVSRDNTSSNLSYR
jgi:hypothetical protein